MSFATTFFDWTSHNFYPLLRARPGAQTFLSFMSIAYDWRLGTGVLFTENKKFRRLLHYTRCALHLWTLAFEDIFFASAHRKRRVSTGPWTRSILRLVPSPLAGDTRRWQWMTPPGGRTNSTLERCLQFRCESWD